MPNGKKNQLDEFEAKIYKYIMSYDDYMPDFANVLLRVDKEIAEGRLLVRKDLIDLIIRSLPETKKKAVLDETTVTGANYEEKLNNFLKRRKEKEEKNKEENLNIQQKVDDEKKKRKVSDIILEDKPAPEKVYPKGRLEAEEISDYIKYLELASDNVSFQDFTNLLKYIFRTVDPYNNNEEVEAFLEKTFVLYDEIGKKIKEIDNNNKLKGEDAKEKAFAAAKEAFKDKRTEWIKNLSEFLKKNNDTGLSKNVYLKSFNVVLDRVPRDIIEKDDKHAINLDNGDHKIERISFAEEVLGYVNEAIININNKFIRPVQEVLGEKDTIMHILSSLEKKLREEIPALSNAGDFPVPDYKEIESEGVQVYLKKLDTFLLSHLKEKGDFERLKVVETYYGIERKNLETVSNIEKSMSDFVGRLVYSKTHKTTDMKKFVADKFRGQLVESGVDLDSVREFSNVTELELWCKDTAVAINKAIRYGEAEADDINKVFNRFTKLDNFKKGKSNGYDEDWKKKPQVNLEYKHVYYEDLFDKKLFEDIEKAHSKCYLRTALKMEEFLSKKDENAIGRALYDAGYNKEMTRWFVCKKILIYAMGVHKKTLDDIAKMTAEEKAEMGRLFAKDVSAHPFNGAKIRDLSADEIKENALWYGKMYGEFYKNLYKEKMNLNEAGYADELDPQPDYSGSKLYGIATIIDELDSIDLVILNNKDASKPDLYNVHGVDRLAEFKKGFASVSEAAGYEKALELKKQISAFSDIYYRMTSPEYDPITQFICKVIVQYEIEPKLASIDLKTDDEETKKTIEELTENLTRANKIMESEGFSDLFNSIEYKKDDRKFTVDGSEAKGHLNDQNNKLKWLKYDIEEYKRDALEYQALIGFIAKNVPGTPEIVKIYAQLPEGLVDEKIQKAVSGGYPEDIKAETEAGKAKKHIQDEEEREKARIAEEERKKQEALRIAEENKKRDARINQLEKEIIPQKLKKIGELKENLSKAGSNEKAIKVNTVQLTAQRRTYFENRRELRHLICDRDYSDNPDRLIYEKSLAKVIEIRDLRKVNAEARSIAFKNDLYIKKTLELSSEEYTAMSNLRGTDYFYQERERIYKTCLEEVLKSKGVEINSPEAENTKVTVEEIMAQKEKLFSDAQYQVFDESDIRIEMEKRLISENETAKEISEMLDDLYNYRDDLGGSNKYKDTDRPRMPKKFSPGSVDDEMMPDNMREMQAAAALRKGVDIKGKDAADYETTYETSSIFLDQILKIAIHKDYLVNLFKKDDAKINEELSRSFPAKKHEDRRTANSMYTDSYKAMNYMTQFFPHYSENGPVYYSNFVIPDLLKNLTEQYRHAKKLGTKKAMLDFYKSIDGACFDYVADNIQKFASAHPINDLEKEMYTLPDPGHGGVYVHDSRLLENISFFDQMSPDKGDTFENAAMKVVSALTQENNAKLYRWDDVEKEIIYQLAGKRFKDVDFTGIDSEQLINNPDAVKLLEQTKQYLIDLVIIDSDPEEIIKDTDVEEDEAPELDDRELSAEELKLKNIEKRRTELTKEIDDYNDSMKKAYDEMRVIASEISYTVPDLAKYERDGIYEIDNFQYPKVREEVAELFDKIFGNFKKVMNIEKYNFKYQADYDFQGEKKTFNLDIDFVNSFYIYDKKGKVKLRPGEMLSRYCQKPNPFYTLEDKKLMIMHALTDPNSRFSVSFAPLKVTLKEEKKGNNVVLSKEIAIDEDFEVPTFRDEAFLQHRRQARYKDDLVSTTYEYSFKMDKLGNEEEQKHILSAIYGDDAVNHHPYDIRELFFAWICSKPEIESLEDFYTDLRLDKPHVFTMINEFKAEVMQYRFDWHQGYYAKLIGNAFKRVSSIKMYNYDDNLTARIAEIQIREKDTSLQAAARLLGTVIPFEKSSGDFRNFKELVEKEYGKENLWQHADQLNFIYEGYRNIINPDLSLKERVLNLVVVNSLRKPFLDKTWDREIFDADAVRKDMKRVDVTELELTDEECKFILENGLRDLEQGKKEVLLADVASMIPSAKPLALEAPKLDRPVKVKKEVKEEKHVKEEKAAKPKKRLKRPETLDEIVEFNKKIYGCINKLIGIDFKKLFAEKNIKLPDSSKLKDPSKLTEQDLRMTDTMFDMVFGDLAELQNTFPKDFLDSFNIYKRASSKDKQPVKNQLKDELVRLKSAKANNVKYVNSLTRLQILMALFDDKLMIGFTPKIYSEDSIGATEINSNNRLLINGKIGIKRPVQASFKNKINKLNSENHDSIFELKTNKFEMYKKNFALEFLTMEDLRSAEKEFTRLFGGEIDNDYINKHTFSSFSVTENGKEAGVWEKCADIRKSFAERVRNNDPALSDMDPEVRRYFTNDSKISPKLESAFNAMLVKAYIIHALGNENTVIKVKNDFLGEKEVLLNTQKRNERQKAAYDKDEKIYNYKIESNERIKQDNGRFGTLSVTRQFSYDNIFANPNEAISKFKDIGFKNGENASGFYILYCVGVLGKSIEELLKATPEQKKEYGERFLKDYVDHPFGRAFWNKSIPDFRKSLKWYGNHFLKAYDKIAKENLKMPSGKTFTNVETAEKYVASKEWVMALVYDALDSISTKNILVADSNMDYMFDDSNYYKSIFRTGYISLSKAGPLHNVFDGMLNPAYSMKFRAYQKLVGETEVSCFTRNTSAIGTNIDDERVQKKNPEIKKSVKTLNKITASDWNSILAVEEKMKDFTDDETRLIMNNSISTLSKKNPDLVIKAIDALIGEDNELFINLKQVKTLIDNIAQTPEDKVKYLTGALATISFDENDPEMLYNLGICSPANMYHENLKYENTKPEDLVEAAKVFDDIFGENIDLNGFIAQNKASTMSSEVDKIFDDIDKGNNISEEVRIRFKKAYILHGIVRNGAEYGVGDHTGLIKAPEKSEKRRRQERAYAEEQQERINNENAAVKKVEDDSIVPFNAKIANISILDLSEIYLLKINSADKLNAEMNVDDFLGMSEAELDKCDKLFDKIFGDLIKQQKPLYDQYEGRKKDDFYQDLFYPGHGEHDFLKLVDDDGNCEDGVDTRNYEKFQKASLLHALAMNGGKLVINRFSKQMTDFKTKKIEVKKTNSAKTLTKPNISVEVQNQLNVIAQNDDDMGNLRENIKNTLARLTSRRFKADIDPNYIWDCLDNPPSGSEKDMAKNYMVINCMAKAYDKETTLDDLNSLVTYINSKDFNTDITKLKENLVFKAVKKETDDHNKKNELDKKNMLQEWHQVTVDSEKIRLEYEKDLSAFGSAQNTLADFIFDGFKIEKVAEVPEDDVPKYNNGIENLDKSKNDILLDKGNIVNEKDIKKRMDELIAEEEANKTINERYQRLASIITAQILSDKNNIKLIQGFVTGHFDLMTVTEKTIDYLKKNKVLGKDNKGVNKEDINRKLADGTFKKNVLKDVMNKEKTVDRTKAAEKKAEAKAGKLNM